MRGRVIRVLLQLLCLVLPGFQSLLLLLLLQLLRVDFLAGFGSVSCYLDFAVLLRLLLNGGVLLAFHIFAGISYLSA